MGSIFQYPNFEAAGINILAEGCNGGIEPGQYWAELKVYCNTDYIWDFLNYIYGLPGTPTQVGMGMPMSYPFNNDPYVKLFADHASWTAMGVKDTKCDWKFVLINIHFRTLPYDESLRTVEMKFAGNFVTLPLGAFVFPSDGTSTQGAGVFVPECDFIVKYHRQFQQFINYPLINSLAGTVNSETMTIGTLLSPPVLSFSPGTVLYTGADISLETNIGGFNTCQIAHSFSYRQVLHNYLLNPTTGLWEAPQNASDHFIYDAQDLNSLVLL